ncbi:MAG TPA: type II CAAX endopeptidase family protein, partial [Sediminibacterium sp.]|nr:type II CAAX endopeptidase family protein [Sediminibacterium sp.]
MTTERPVINYPLQFAFLVGLMGVSILLSALLIPLIGSMVLHVPFLQVLTMINQPEHANLARWMNTLASFLSFFLPSLALARILSRHPFEKLGFTRRIQLREIGVILGITVASILLSGSLGALNEKIPLPAGWLAKARQLEDTYKTSVMAMAHMQSLSDYLLALLVMAAAPALFEEVLFRGGFQQVLVGWTRHKWAGLLLTSILFSAIHFSYFGFLPRMALGIVLGLIFLETGKLWLSILLHFMNNALVVTQLYFAGLQGKPIDKTMDESAPIWWGLIALVLLGYLFRVLRQWENEQRRRNHEIPEHSGD